MELKDRGRRKVLKGALAAGAAAVPGVVMPALAQGERAVPFTDVPEGFQAPPRTPNTVHWQDTREITTFLTDNEDFYLVQHYGQPVIDNDAWRLRVTGMVDNELELSLRELTEGDAFEQHVGFECGGNSGRLLHGLVGNANWRGASLRGVLERAGIQDGAKEVVFFGADTAVEEIRGRNVEKAFARSLSVEDAMRPENMLAFAMNGEPLPHYHGKPLRLLVPGWYGVANVKWLTQIHVQGTRYMGRFMGRDYVTLKRETVGGVERWVENSVTAMNTKSVVARVVERGGRFSVQGFALNDGSPLRGVEVKIDDGPWRPARMDPRNSRHSWKLFACDWENPAPGEHVVVSRAVDAAGRAQPAADELPEKVSRWEDFGQFPRTVRI